eukprot:scaffold53220_cov61-Phaeocystis_antarctica.AAC.1
MVNGAAAHVLRARAFHSTRALPQRRPHWHHVHSGQGEDVDHQGHAREQGQVRQQPRGEVEKRQFT